MLFNSYQFLIFFPAVCLVYYLIPQKIRHFWLLIASYYFYMCWNAKYALLLLTSTVITYLSGLALGRIDPDNRKKKNLVVALSFVSNLGILFFFKYFNFFFSLLAQGFAKAHIALNMPQVDVLLPVGISFYTFQALSYTMDVYRGQVKEERDFFRYALFVSFFPQLVAGPIERSKNLLHQLRAPKDFNLDDAFSGILLMIWGFFLKIVVADRIAKFVDTVYADPTAYDGTFLIIATILFAVQIYCDFAGYSTIAMGAAKILGIQLMENFDAPYISQSVADFWRRWHISLTSWFKDYLYIPLGGSRKGIVRKYINKMIVFLVSGLWHGASLSFVAWGGLNGLYQIAGEILMPVRTKISEALHIRRENHLIAFIRTLITFILVDFAWIFFRAGHMKDAITVIRQMVSVHDTGALFGCALFECGIDERNFLLMIITIGVLLITDILKRRGIVVRDMIAGQNALTKSVIIALSVLFIMTFGIYGPAYDAANFIYFQF